MAAANIVTVVADPRSLLRPRTAAHVPSGDELRMQPLDRCPWTTPVEVISGRALGQFLRDGIRRPLRNDS